jgi:hypothetical protein
MRRFNRSCVYSLALWGILGVSWVRAASSSDEEIPRYPVLAYFVAGISMLFILVIAGLPSRKES